ncbi:MAG TPA: sulfite exporter TauE/SafE family protein, partial [Gammaproteobacteria bacterium]|nr:sulfite exporter TauE/SafE family protein [Gammaproteobacteria bacterium]
AIAIVIHARSNSIRWDIAQKLIPGLLVGAMIGAYLASQLNTQGLIFLFSGFLILVALRFIFNWHNDLSLPVPAAPIMYGIGAVLGSITAMLGLGGGLLLIPFLSYLPLSMREVSALSLVCIFPVALLATLGYIIFGFNAPDLPRFTTGYVYWPAVLPLILASSLVTPLGIAMAKRLSSLGLKRIFGFVLLGMSISLLLLE